MIALGVPSYRGASSSLDRFFGVLALVTDLKGPEAERFITYAIRGERGTGMISVNGSAARRASAGDLIIIASFAQVHEDQVASHSPQLVFVDANNRQTELRHQVPIQLGE